MFRFTLILSIVMLAAVSVVSAAGGDTGDYELGLFAGVAFPDDYGDGIQRLKPDDDVVYGVRAGRFFSEIGSFELSYQQLTADAFSLGSPVDLDVNSIRANVLANFLAGQSVRPFITFGLGREMTEVDGLFNDEDWGLNAGGGVRWFFNDTFGLRVDGRLVRTKISGPLNDYQMNVEGTVGATWAFGGTPPADSDGDGVNDRKDRCPDTPRGAKVDERGCPLDGDGDGVADGLDRCPDTPAGVPVDADGCPKDSDGDGVHDGDDRCPDTPRGALVDARGCPKDSDDDGVYDGIDKCPDTPSGTKVDARGCTLDSDGDGVVDSKDRCPDTPRGTKVDAKGCPADSDGDGVPDSRDRCPGTPRGTKVDEKGCQVLFEGEQKTLVLEGVNFEFDRDVLTPEARAILDRVAGSLREWPEIRVEVSGHTDSKGAEAYNLRLSSGRAAAVREYLVGKGIDRSRLVSKGYGESSPIAGNDTEANRLRNRRVELKRLDK